MVDYERWGLTASAHFPGLTTSTSNVASSNFGVAFGERPAPAPAINDFPIVVDLPDSHLQLIGNIMVHWSLQEWLLQHILFPLVTDNEAVARLSVGTPRSNNAVERIEQICKAKGISIKTDFAKLKNELARLEKIRDQVGHGIWILNDAQKYCAVVYSGNWEAGQFQGTPRRVTPQVSPIDDAYLIRVVEDIKATIEITKILARETGVARET